MFRPLTATAPLDPPGTTLGELLFDPSRTMMTEQAFGVNPVIWIDRPYTADTSAQRARGEQVFAFRRTNRYRACQLVPR